MPHTHTHSQRGLPALRSNRPRLPFADWRGGTANAHRRDHRRSPSAQRPPLAHLCHTRGCPPAGRGTKRVSSKMLAPVTSVSVAMLVPVTAGNSRKSAVPSQLTSKPWPPLLNSSVFSQSTSQAADVPCRFGFGTLCRCHARGLWHKLCVWRHCMSRHVMQSSVSASLTFQASQQGQAPGLCT